MEKTINNFLFWISPTEAVARIARKSYLFSVPSQRIEEKSICMKAKIEKDKRDEER